jgi:hypothetical protein
MPAVVVLPAPLGPRSPKISPWKTARLRPSTAATSIPGYNFVKLTVRMTSLPVVVIKLSVVAPTNIRGLGTTSIFSFYSLIEGGNDVSIQWLGE